MDSEDLESSKTHFEGFAGEGWLLAFIGQSGPAIADVCGHVIRNVSSVQNNNIVIGRARGVARFCLNCLLTFLRDTINDINYLKTSQFTLTINLK